eukprot:COSAG05_NODE_8439_length_704_cov_0.961983_1_plen_28_part_01
MRHWTDLAESFLKMSMDLRSSVLAGRPR